MIFFYLERHILIQTIWTTSSWNTLWWASNSKKRNFNTEKSNHPTENKEWSTWIWFEKARSTNGRNFDWNRIKKVGSDLGHWFILIFSTKNDQLRARILRLERELRHKDLELGKALFDMKNTDINELKMAVEVRARKYHIHRMGDI